MVKCRLFLYIEASEITATDENSKALTLEQRQPAHSVTYKETSKSTLTEAALTIL